MKFSAKLCRILDNPQKQWQAFASTVRRGGRTAYRDLKVDWDVYNSRDYLFTHDSIVASVAVEEDGYTIKPATKEIVNSNGNAWTPEVLLNCYKTFIGGENYYEHVQVPSLSKGKILDAVIRQVKHNGESIYVVDILVATNRMHKSLVERIENGDLTTLSMGATVKYVQCSVCGKIFNSETSDESCRHLKNNMRQEVVYQGKKKFCAELCGAINPRTKEYIKDSCVFIEASWVEQPAYEGAVLNYLVETPEITAKREEKKELEAAFTASLSTMRFADRDGAMAMRLADQLGWEEQLTKYACRTAGIKKIPRNLRFR